MKFYDCSTAPSPRRARMFIAEKGLQIETCEISIAKGEQLGADFLAINPAATVPVLVTGAGDTLTENIAIATYLEAAFPDPPLMGVTPSEKAQVAMWNAICEQKGGLPIAEVLRNTHPAMKDRAIPGQQNHAQIPALAERGGARLTEFFTQIENRLGDTPYLAGDNFTLADITGFVLIDFAKVIGRKIPADHFHSLAWFNAIKSRPSANI